MVYLESHRLYKDDIYISPNSYKYRKELYKDRLEKMVLYSTNEQMCRSQYFEEYFGIKEATECGVCDICIARRRMTKDRSALQEKSQSIREKILESITNQPCDIKLLARIIHHDVDLVIVEVDKMLNENIITIDINDKLKPI